MSVRPIYFDNNATTPVDPLVCQVLTDFLCNVSGNPSSVHSFGQEAKKYLNRARETIAKALGVHPQEIIFTSGATEAMNMLMRPGHIITSDVEHACVYSQLQDAPNVTFLPAGLTGVVTPAQVQEAITDQTSLITLIAANNETGVKLDIEEVAAVAKAAGIPLVLDGVAWLGKDELTIPSGVSAMAFSGHKFHAPKGVGFLFLRKGFKLNPMIVGGAQEFNKRGGTENLPGIVAMAKAVTLFEFGKLSSLRDRLEQGIISRLPNVTVNGSGPRVSNVTNLAFEGVEGETLLANLDIQGIAVSHGSACSSGALEPSRVLLRMGVPPELAHASIRFSLSRFNTEEEVDRCIEAVVSIVAPRP